LVNQRIATMSAAANFQTAKLTREVAEIAQIEYEEGIFKQDQETLRGAITATQSAVQRAEARLERTRRARQRLNDALAANRGAKTPAEIVTDLDIDDRLEAAERAVDREKA